MLIREAACEAIPKETRAKLHERFAGWLERSAREQARESEELTGYHLEQAYRCLSELGPLDERGRELAHLAAERLATAGARASDRGDVVAAANLLGRAIALLPEAEPARVELLLLFALATGGTGKYRLIGKGLAIYEDLGLEIQMAHAAEQESAYVEMLADDAAAAERGLAVETTVFPFSSSFLSTNETSRCSGPLAEAFSNNRTSSSRPNVSRGKMSVTPGSKSSRSVPRSRLFHASKYRWARSRIKPPPRAASFGGRDVGLRGRDPRRHDAFRVAIPGVQLGHSKVERERVRVELISLLVARAQPCRGLGEVDDRLAFDL
jgi:hypothetical protein